MCCYTYVYEWSRHNNRNISMYKTIWINITTNCNFQNKNSIQNGLCHGQNLNFLFYFEISVTSCLVIPEHQPLGFLIGVTDFPSPCLNSTGGPCVEAPHHHPNSKLPPTPSEHNKTSQTYLSVSSLFLVLVLSNLLQSITMQKYEINQ